MTKKAAAGVPDHNDGAQSSSDAKVAACRGRLLVSDHRHVGVKLDEDEARCAAVLQVYLQSADREGSDSPGVTQDYIHAGKIDGRPKKEA